VAVFRKAPGAEQAAEHASGTGGEVFLFQTVDQVETAFWSALVGLFLVLCLLAFGKRGASAFAAGAAAVL